MQSKAINNPIIKVLLVILIAFSGMLSPGSEVKAATGVTVNDVDSYGIQGMTLYQFDGNNPTATPKASVTITGVTENTGLNGLAVAMNENAFYAATYSYGSNPVSKLYRINENGAAQFVSQVEGVTGNSVIFGGKYYYVYGLNGKVYIGTYDLSTGQKESTEISNYSLPSYQDMGGDLIFDSNGYLWFYQNSSLVQLDPRTSTMVRSVNVSVSDGVPVEHGFRGMSFLPNGNILIVGGLSNPKFYVLNRDTLSTTYIGEMTGGLIYDLASEVTPKFVSNPTPPGVCGPRVVLINGSFEEPAYTPNDPRLTTRTAWFEVKDEYVPGWRTTDSTGLFEVFTKELMDQVPDDDPNDIKHEVPDGLNFVELNSREPAQLYQDVETTPGQTIYWRLTHKGRFGVDTMSVNIGSSTIDPANLPSVQLISTGNDAWQTYTGTYTVPEGQTVTRFGFEAVSTATGSLVGGNILDDIFLGTEPCGVVTKSVDPVDNVQEADILTYTVNFKNDGGDETSNTLFTDLIPDGTEYIPGSLEIVSGPNSGKLTDAAGDDQGEFIANENRVVVRLGNGADGSQAGRIPNVDVLPDGTTVQFKVKILSKYKTTAVSNQATVEYDNLLSGDHETRKSNGVTVDVNRPPIVPDFEETTWKDTTVTGSVYGVDANGDSLTFDKGSDPQNGTVTVNPDGTWTYLPDPDFTGTDSFEVTVSDGKGGTSTSTVTIHVEDPPNQVPETKNYDVTTEKDTSVTGSVYGTDPDGDTLTFVIESNPKHGSVIVNTDGTWEYVPDPGYVGPDIFTVTVSDSKGGVTTSTVTVDVTDKPNNPPVSSGKEVTTEKGTSVTGDVYGTDPDGDPLTYTPGKQPGNGTVIVNPDGSWKYTPDPDFVGEDSFTVIVDDGRGGQTEVKIIVDVTDTTTPPPTNQPPVSPDKEATTEKGTSVTGDVYGTDPDGDPLTYTPGKQPGNGTVIVNPDGSWTYTPDPDFVGDDSFTVIVDDGKGNKTEVTVIVRVTEPNTPPTDPGNGTNPTDPGNGTNPTDPGNGTNPTDPGNGTNPTDPGNGTNPTDPGNGTNPTDPGNGTDPTDPGNGTNPTDPGNGITPEDSGDGAGQSDSAKDNNEMTAGESAGVPSSEEQSGAPQGNKLPNTSTNLFNLGLAGLLTLCAGLVLMIRKRKA